MQTYERDFTPRHAHRRTHCIMYIMKEEVETQDIHASPFRSTPLGRGKEVETGLFRETASFRGHWIQHGPCLGNTGQRNSAVH